MKFTRINERVPGVVVFVERAVPCVGTLAQIPCLPRPARHVLYNVSANIELGGAVSWEVLHP